MQYNIPLNYVIKAPDCMLHIYTCTTEYNSSPNILLYLDEYDTFSFNNSWRYMAWVIAK